MNGMRIFSGTASPENALHGPWLCTIALKANLALSVGQKGAVDSGTAGRLMRLGSGDSESVAISPAMLGFPRQ